MVQTGDPTGTGKGGMSCWGKKMEDELVDSLKVWCVYVFVCLFVCVKSQGLWYRQVNPQEQGRVA